MAKGNGKRVFRRRTRRRSKAKFVKLRELMCFPQVHERIKAGWPIARIADFVQQEKKEYTEVARESLMKTLTLYRESISKTELIQQRMPERVEKWIEETEEAIDEIKELKKLFKLQMGRIEMEAKTEKQLKKLFRTLGGEVFYAMKILQTSAAIKMDYGLVKKAPLEIEGSMNVSVLSADLTRFGSETVQKVIEDPVARRKVVSLVERMAKLEAERQRKLLEEGETEDGKVVDATLEGTS